VRTGRVWSGRVVRCGQSGLCQAPTLCWAGGRDVYGPVDDDNIVPYPLPAGAGEPFRPVVDQYGAGATVDAGAQQACAGVLTAGRAGSGKRSRQLRRVVPRALGGVVPLGVAADRRCRPVGGCRRRGVRQGMATVAYRPHRQRPGVPPPSAAQRAAARSATVAPGTPRRRPPVRQRPRRLAPGRTGDRPGVGLAGAAGLPAHQHAAIVLRYYEDLTEAEAAMAGITAGTVKSRVGRGLARLRLNLEETTNA
jgi:Sigma-70, region 4